MEIKPKLCLNCKKNKTNPHMSWLWLGSTQFCSMDCATEYNKKQKAAKN